MLYFSATDGIHGVEPWKTDGTEAGTVMVKDIYPSFNSPHPGNFIVYNDMLHFTGAAGVGIWRTDGTETNTVKVADLFWGWANPIVFGDAVIFISSVGALGSEPWKMTGKQPVLSEGHKSNPGRGFLAKRLYHLQRRGLFFSHRWRKRKFHIGE
jgi:ELWxxDGT repeat protein